MKFAGDTRAVWIGAGLVFASSLAYAIYLVGGGQLIARLGSTRFTALAMAISTGATIIHYAIARPWPEVLEQPWEIYALAAGMAIFSTIIPVFMQSAAIKHIGAAHASMVGMLGPVATIFMGWAILDEILSAWQLLGAVLVIAGIALLIRR
jgi:drug/metabolite transporter (DMT)-like permease